MQNGSTFLTMLLLLGTVQGLITVGVLYRLKVNQKANRRLAWILLLISLACLNLYILEAAPRQSLFWDVVQSAVPLVVIMPVGPLVYFYIRALLRSPQALTQKDKRHFYTVILDVLPHIVMIVLMIGGFLGLLGSLPLETVGDAIDTYTTYIDIPRWLSLVIYLWMSYTLWRRTPVVEKETASAKWAKRFLLGFTVFSGIW